MSVIIQHKRGTASQWTTLNPTLAAGETGWESDTNKFKIGTGSATWTALPYATLTPAQLSSDYARLASANAFTVGGHTITNDAVGTVPLRINGISGQTANSFEVRNHINTVLFSVFNTGTVFFGPTQTTAGSFISGISGRAFFNTTDAATSPLLVQGAASQSASVLALQNSSGSITANFTAPVNNVNRLNLGGTDLSATLGITVHASGGVGQVIRGAASQSANLQEWQNSAGTVQARIDPAGMATVNALGVAGSPSGISYSFFTSPVNNAIPVVVRGHATQTSDLTQWQLGDGGVRALVSANGRFAIRSQTLADANASLYASGINVTDKPIVARGVSGQTANLTEWQDSAGTVLAAVNGAGLISSVRQISVSQSNAGETMMFVRGAASQTGDSLAVRDSSANTIAGFSATGRLYSGVSGSGQTYLGGLTLGNGSVASQMGIVAGAATTVGAVIRGAASQSADLLQLQNSGGTALVSINAGGGIRTIASIKTTALEGVAATLAIQPAATTTIGAVIRGAASQSADLQEWQNSAGTILAKVDSGGGIFGPNGAKLGLDTFTGVAYNGISNPAGVTTIPSLVVKGNTSQTADLQQWHNSSGTVLASISNIGTLNVNTAGSGILNLGDAQISKAPGSGFIFTSGIGQLTSLGIQTAATNAEPLKVVLITPTYKTIIRGAASQTASLIEYQSSASTILSGVNGVGQVFTGSTTPILTAAGGTIQSIATGANPLVTMASAHGFTVGDLVTLSGTTGGTYNGTFVVASTPLTTTFTITSNLTAGQAAAGGTVSDPAQLSVTTKSAGTTGVIVKRVASQTANLMEFQLQDGTIMSRIDSSGDAYFGLISSSYQTLITSGGAAILPLRVRGATSQSANLQEWQNSAGTVLTSISSSGTLRVPIITDVAGTSPFFRMNGTNIQLDARLPGNKGLVVTGVASQTANLQEWQDSAGTVLAQIQSGGNFVNTTNIKTPAFLDTGTATAINFGATRNVGLFASSGSFGGGQGVLNIANATTAPTTDPTGGGILYVDAGALKYKGTSGTASTIVNADSTETASDATVATATVGLGYMGLPQNSTTTGAYTVVAADAGKHIYASATRTVTINSNANLALPIGTTLTFIAGDSATMTIAITSDTMYLAGVGTTGSRTLAPFGIATAVKLTSTTWIISGNGLT